jgi:hypothetical protein
LQKTRRCHPMPMHNLALHPILTKVKFTIRSSSSETQPGIDTFTDHDI